MKQLLLLVLFFCSAQHINGQKDTLTSPNGPIVMTPVLHSTFVLEWGDKTIFMDPYGGSGLFQDFGAPDLICITHAHGDHMNPETLRGLDLSKAILIAPQSVVEKLGDLKFKDIKALANGQDINLFDVNVLAVPMYNLPEDNTSRHERGWGNGYVISIDGKRIYVSGDTEDIPEMRDLKDIDFAFVCMNLPYTMTVEQASEAVLAFKPKVVYPFHYRGSGGFSDVKSFKAIVEDKDQNIEVRLREWYTSE